MKLITLGTWNIRVVHMLVYRAVRTSPDVVYTDSACLRTRGLSTDRECPRTRAVYGHVYGRASQCLRTCQTWLDERPRTPAKTVATYVQSPR